MTVDGKDGGAYRNNVIQFLDPATSKLQLDKVYTYYGVEDEATAGEDDGWYTYNLNDEDKDDIYSNDVQFKVHMAPVPVDDAPAKPREIPFCLVFSGDTRGMCGIR